MNSSSPNFLFIQVDQLTAASLSCYGNPVSVTPNISMLAEDGIVFESAYTNFPLCAPSRFSMMSGQLASAIGAYDNGAEFPSAVPTFVHYLRSLGYQTCLVGKMHFVGADQLHGFEERLTTDIYPADFGWTGDWTEIKQRHANDIRSFTQAGRCLRNPQIEYDDEITHRCRRKLYDLARRKDQRPFFLLASFTHPHDPYQCTEEHWNRYRHDEIDMPVVAAGADGAQDPYSDRLLVQYGLDRFSPSEAQIRTARHAYYGSVSYVDDQVGFFLQVLKQTGLDQHTMVVFTTDHGDMLGERGLWYKKTFFEHASRIPLIFSGPAVARRRIECPVSLVDLLPTLVDLARNDRSSPLIEEPEGCSLLDLATGGRRTESRPVYAENLAEGALAPILMVRKDRYKYVCSGIDPEQMFDLKQDAGELKNIIASPDHQRITDEMRRLAREKWDIEELNHKIRASQRRRLFLAGLPGRRIGTDWDYRPADQASGHCLRADQSYNDWAYDGTVGLIKP